MRLWGTGEGVGLPSSLHRRATDENPAFPAEHYLQELRRQNLDDTAARLLDSLAQESDPELFFNGLLDFANRELNHERPVSAALAYQAASDGALAFPDLIAKARQRLNAIQGVGEPGARVEYLLRDLAKQSLDPAMIAAMGTAGLAYRTIRLSGLSALAASPGARAWLSPAGRNFAASLAGFAVEAPVFTISARGAHELMGHSQDWSGPALHQALCSGALVLGGLKIGGAASSGLERLGGRLPSSTYRQSGMLAGIYLGRGLEQLSGLHPRQDGATTLSDSLLTLLQFNIAGRLTPGLFGKNLAHWEKAVALKNQAPSISSGGALFQPALNRPMVTAGQPPRSMPGLLALSSAYDHEGGSSPPPSSARSESLRSSSSKPPVEHGVIVQDALAWGTRQSRGSEDVSRMIGFVEQIRAEMWNSLNLYVDKPLARALGQGKTLYVRVKPVDGSLDNYQIELHANATLREVHPDYVEFVLDAKLGSLKLHDLPSQAAMLGRLQAGGVDQSRGFLGYYRSLLDFESAALQSDHLVAAMPANVRALVLQQATNYVRPAVPEASPPQFVPTPVPEPQSTPLVNYFPYVAEFARQEVESYSENAGIRDPHRQRLHGLVQKLLVGLHARESAEPRMIRFAYLQARMRPDPETPTKRIIEVLTPAEAMKRPPMDNEVLFALVRHPSATGDEFSYLHHLYLNADAQGLPTREADLLFQKGLGISFNLKIKLESLSLESFDSAAAQKWMRENNYMPE